MSNDKDHDDKDKKNINIHIDDKHYNAPNEIMTGAELRQLAQPPIAANRDLFKENPGPHDDEKIADSQAVKLKSGDKFYSAPAEINPGDAFFLPDLDTEYLNEKGYSWELPANGYLLMKTVKVAADKYDRDAVELLIQIPSGYPNAALDMFFVSPELKLKTGGYPVAADVFVEHLGRSWQRFSRHLNGTWLPGRDSIKSFLALVLGELQGKR